jgi:flagellar protein FlgJ
MIVRQLSQTLKARRTGAAEPLAAAAGVSEASSGSADLAPTTAPFGAAPGAAGPGGAAPGAPGTAGPSIVRRFHAAMRDAAHAASSATGIPADFMVAQAGLESGWGRHQPRTADGQPSHNLFGIKAGTNWHGAVAHAVTTEIVNGAPQQVQQTFRAYASYDDAFQDYAALLSGNARYARALDASNPQAFAGALQKAGYATDPHYAGKVAHAIQLVTGLQA